MLWSRYSHVVGHAAGFLPRFHRGFELHLGSNRGLQAMIPKSLVHSRSPKTQNEQVGKGAAILESSHVVLDNTKLSAVLAAATICHHAFSPLLPPPRKSLLPPAAIPLRVNV